ncbi:S41 family peptidase [Pseudomonas putida]|uniref:S41 family peptidase n=3 Tax=Pseudomonas putida TaxID=303 RepID=A0AAW6PMY9_PSEPU|nr:S41 family peptidase [Pseudomonas putida]MCE0879620.1 S41 family peptidase [Pseudomonas putida]MDF3870114.1 S41 family peptidase [Pseudomonas putida]MDF3875947.1 S41 family peptidase [Pseudomonas putida]
MMGNFHMRVVRTVLAIVFMGAGVVGSVSADESARRRFVEMAVGDLSVVHQLIASSHPGAIDQENKNFTDWVEKGYRQASQLALRVSSQRDAQAVLGFYISGFKDGHVGVYPARAAKSSWAGFMVDMRGEGFVVTRVAKAWPVPLPPVGSSIISCDGKAVRKILADEISPYVDRRLDLKSTWRHLARHLTVDDADAPVLARKRASNCVGFLASGVQQNFALSWQEDDGQLKDGLTQPQPPQALNNLGGGRYWVHASNFALSAADNAALERMLDTLRHIEDAKLVVLDTRGNRGGNSLVGARILSALLGEAFVESLGQSSHSYAMWRVSALALATLDSALASMQGNHEKNNDAYTFVSGMRESMNAALVGKQDWLRQPDTSSLDQGLVKDSSPVRFKGQLVLVTDSFCASACLDFADAVLAVPGATHFGLSTSGDTLYIDTGSQALPSGAQFWLPLKVWRGRVRGNNQSYDPRYIFDGDINDTSAGQKWVLGYF